MSKKKEQDVAELLNEFEEQEEGEGYLAPAPKPVSAFTDRVGRYVVVLDTGAVYSRASTGRQEPWELIGTIPGTEADMEA